MIKITRLSAPEAPVTRLRVDGRIVLATASEVAVACHAALAGGPPVLLDLSGVTFVDAEGAGALTGLERRNVTVIGSSPFIGALIRSHAEREDIEESAPPPADEAEALAALVRREGPSLLALAKRLFPSDAAAYDAVQTAFRTLGELPRSASDVADAATGLRHAVARSACDQVRSRRGTDSATIAPLLPRFDETGHWIGGVAPLDLASDDAASRLPAAVDRAIAELPAWFRTILVLRDVARVDAATVASLLAIAPDALRTDLHCARQALHAVLVRALGTTGTTAEHLSA